MRILLSCQFTTLLRDLLRAQGHDAYTNDIDPCEGDPTYHIQADAIETAYSYQWDMMIAMPPCTYLTNSGVRWLQSEEGRWEKMIEAAAFYTKLALAPIPKKVLENPTMHGYARQRIPLRWPIQYVHPWMFGDGFTKRTGLERWNLPELKPTNIVAGRSDAIHKMAPGPNRGKDRGRTFPGIAKALAEQYGAC